MEKTTLMQHIRTAASKLNGCKLTRLTPAAASLDAICDTLGLGSREEAMALVAILDRQCNGRSTDLDDLSTYFQCSALDVMSLMPALNALTAKGYVTLENRSERLLSRKQFTLCTDIFYALIEGREVRPVAPSANAEFDQFDFCNAVHDLIDARSNNRIETEKLFFQAGRLEEDYADMPLVRGLRGLVTDLPARTLFYEMCRDFAADSDGGHSNLDRTLSDFYDRILARVEVKKQLIENTHPLIAAELIELRNDDELHLTDEGISLLFGPAASAIVKSKAGLDRYQFVDKVHDLIDDARIHSFCDTLHLCRKVQKMECENLQLEYVRKLRDCVIDREDRLVFYAICYELIDDDQYGIDQLNEIYEKSGAIKKRKEFKQEQHMLQKRGLVEVATAGFFNETVLRLTEKGKELFLGEDVELFEKKTTDKDLIQPEKIAERHLFFSETLDRQLATLRRSLDEANYANLRARLEERHLPTGVAALFYGQPGTGKTESVMQMARATGRAVMHVDISATKTCWFGESEKLIKEVFTRYRRLCEKNPKTPILLFNEADAVFSKRKDATASNVAQTENAIQNIILEEMEKLDGILIATTNLADNLDKAFERRFLFKIRFDRPTLEAKASIWRDKLPALTDTEAAELASRFDLSGGEIDNVVRKVLMEEVVSGETPSLAMATRIASEERISKETRKIGFTC